MSRVKPERRLRSSVVSIVNGEYTTIRGCEGATLDVGPVGKDTHVIVSRPIHGEARIVSLHLTDKGLARLITALQKVQASRQSAARRAARSR